MADGKSTFEVSEDDYAKAVFEEGDNLIVDLSGIEELKFEAIPKGIYELQLDELQYGKSKSSGKPMFTAIWTVDGGDYANRKLYQFLSFSPGAVRGTKTQLMRIAPDVFAGQFNPQEVADSGSVLGRRVKGRVTVEEGQNGQDQNRVDILPNSGSSAPAQGAEDAGGKFFQ